EIVGGEDALAQHAHLVIGRAPVATAAPGRLAAGNGGAGAARPGRPRTARRTWRAGWSPPARGGRARASAPRVALARCAALFAAPRPAPDRQSCARGGAKAPPRRAR